VGEKPASSADIAAIEEYNQRLATATSNGDLTTLERLIAVDHVTLPPNQPPVLGRDDSIAIMRSALERFRVTETHRATKTEVGSTLAYQWGEFSVSLVPKSGGKTLSRSGKYLRVYRRCTDGSWTMIVDSFSANQPDEGWDEIVAG
jgi:ketosteroid isomerase-like protein